MNLTPYDLSVDMLDVHAVSLTILEFFYPSETYTMLLQI